MNSITHPHDSSQDVTYLEAVSQTAEAFTSAIQDQRDELQALIEHMKEDIAEQVECLNRYVFSAVRNAPSEDHRHAIVNYLYWQVPDASPGWIANALNLSMNQVCYYAGPFYSTVTCDTCNTEFEYAINSRAAMRGFDRKSRFTCPDCDAKRGNRWQEEQRQRQAEIMALRQMPYAQYLQSPHWQDVRRRALKRANFQCQICNAGNTQLHVHHRTYERRGEELNSDVIVLCATCHKTFHENGKLSK